MYIVEQISLVCLQNGLFLCNIEYRVKFVGYRSLAIGFLTKKKTSTTFVNMTKRFKLKWINKNVIKIFQCNVIRNLTN